MCLLVFGLVSLQASARRTSQLRRNCWACEPRIWPNNLSSRARLRKYFWPVSHGTKRLCHICGKMHKKVWIAAGDIILVGLRDYQDDKADVILKYMPDEVRLLKAYGELPDGTKLNEGVAVEMEEKDDTGENYIEFEDEDIDKI